MKGQPTSFWGKLEHDSSTRLVTAWHPLMDHCADVAACASALLGLPTWRHRLAQLYGREDLDAVTCERLAALAALHDIGKFNLGFQARGRPELGATAGHVREALTAIGRDVMHSVEALGDWGPGTTGLLVAAICHHGRPYSFQHAVGYEPVLWQARHGLDPAEGVDRLVAACRVWFPLAFAAPEPQLPEDAGFEHAFAGLVMLADWLGSDGTVFKFTVQGDGDRMRFSRAAAKRLILENWLDISESRRSDRAGHDPFGRVAGPRFQARPAQAAMLDLPRTDPGSITILESETGSGKTEAALARFVTLFSAGAVDGMYFALPTRTAASEMYQRVFAAAQRAFADPPPVVQAVPGYLRVDDVAGKHLPRFEVLWPDTDRERFRHRSWAGENPKRYLAGCVVVGTIDQVLLSSLRVGHAHLRATALLRQLLVVDEVHASDTYMTRVLEDVLARHVKAGGHALLLSATLAGETRTRLLHPGERVTLPNLNETLHAPYPLISHRGEAERVIPVNSDGPARVVDFAIKPWLEDPEVVAAAALDAARSGAKVLVVKNTVADCLETQRCLEQIATTKSASELLFACAGAIAPHHARFARLDREVLDKALENALGNGSTRAPGGRVLIATQTVQQSLDLDADFLVTDLCPMDVLLQRIGRLHRHSRARPAGFNNARAVILVPAQRDLGVLINDQGRARHHHGLGTVYGDLRSLETTWRLLEEAQIWTIPEMNRALVERSLHSSALDAIAASGGPAWQAHAQRTLGTQRGEARQADLNLVDWTTPYSETTFAQDERVPTRLGESDRRVHFAVPFASPFLLRVDELTVPGRWAGGISPMEETAEAVANGGGVTRFRFGGRQFVYDRHGLRPDKAKHGEISDDDGP